MSHALVTITAPVAAANLAAAEQAIDALENPCSRALAERLDVLDVPPEALPSRPELGTHFMSMHAFASREPLVPCGEPGLVSASSCSRTRSSTPNPLSSAHRPSS